MHRLTWYSAVSVTNRDARLTLRVLTAVSRSVIIADMDALEKAISTFGTVSAMASAIGVKPNVIGNWRLRKQVPAEHCRAIEAATGRAVTRYELRPDVFGDSPSDPMAA